MISRRTFSRLGLGVAAASMLPLAWPARADTLTYNDDGLIHQPWFLESFLILNEDLAEATANGKRFAVFWELKGCPYCLETHRVNLAKPEVVDYVTSNFTVLQLNLIGSRTVTDFDGETLSEKELARKWRISFTPTFQFFPETASDADGKSGRDIEVARMPGYFKPEHFTAMFRFVKEKAYREVKFHEYLRGGA